MTKRRTAAPPVGPEPLEARALLSRGSWSPEVDPGPDADRRLTVLFRDPAPARSTRALLEAWKATIIPRERNRALVILGPTVNPEAASTALGNQKDVIYAAPELHFQGFLTPNDPRFGEQFGLNDPTATATNDFDINAPTAWDITTGTPAPGRSPVIVAVADTGVDYTHPDLYLNIALNSREIPATIGGRASSGIVDTNGDGQVDFYDLNSLNAAGTPVNSLRVAVLGLSLSSRINAAYSTDFNGNGYVDAGDLLADGRWANGDDADFNGWTDDLVGYDFFNSNNNPQDISSDSHGTKIAGIIGAMTNNGVGIAGVSWGARILPVKIAEQIDDFPEDPMLQGIYYAGDRGARVLNASFGTRSIRTLSPRFPRAVFDAIRAVGEAQPGTVTVAAAGNFNGNNNDINPVYPASFLVDAAGNPLTTFPASVPTGFSTPSYLVSVTATNRNGTLAGFADTGPVSVNLAVPGVGILTTVRGTGYATDSGTSFAAPFVAGIAALRASQTPDSGTGSFTAVELGQRLRASFRTGAGGRVANARAAVATSGSGQSNVAFTATASPSIPGALVLNFPDLRNPAPGFRILRAAHPDFSDAVQVTTTGRSTSLVNSGLEPHRTYYYLLNAGNTLLTTAGTTPRAGSPPAALLESFDGADTLRSSDRVTAGTWGVAGGVVAKSSQSGARPEVQKLLLGAGPSAVGVGAATNLEITAKVRVDSFRDAGNHQVRVGVGLGTDSAGLGVNLVFRRLPDGAGAVQLYDDRTRGFVGRPVPFEWQTGSWYWFQLRAEPGRLLARVWSDGTTAAPLDVKLVQAGWGGVPGVAALNGGSVTIDPARPHAIAFALASFDDVSVRAVPASPGGQPPAVASTTILVRTPP
ncbi:MAG TPA: S8 family serine peptidase, partial [Isosphaeraceae bacterium]